MEWNDAATGMNWDIEIEGWTDVDGRQEPIAMKISPAGFSSRRATVTSGLTGEVLRRVPWGTLIRDDRVRLSKALRSGEVRTSAALGSTDELADRFAPARGRTRTPEALEAVATVYREAWHSGESPTRAVADAFQISYSTAAKRVAAARRAGHLPPASPGKAGA
jgi:hypothetical protein